jgi:hypothetical protein
LLAKFSHAGGFCYTAPTPQDAPGGDDLDNCARSSLRLFEGGVELGPAHSLHDDIHARGGGRFSHWGRWLMFSASDGSDPRTNGRTYTILYSTTDDPRRAVLNQCMNLDYDSLDLEQRYYWGERAFNTMVPNVRLSEFGRCMFADGEFLSDYERFDRANYRSYDRKFALKEFLKLALPLAGDLAECGVFRGASAYLMAKAMTRANCAKKLHLFDSFAGLSKPKPDVDGSYWKTGALACGVEEVAANLQNYSDRLVFHPGWIPDKFGDVEEKRFCFLHVDVDLYEPTYATLEFFGPRMVPGGLIICDDYGFETCPGAKKAVDKFAAAHMQTIIHLPTGQGVVFF